MAISNIGGSGISADLLYQFYDNKAITPKIRATVQQRQNEADAKSESSTGSASASASKSGPAARVSITDQLVRMNMSNNTTKSEKDGDKKETDAAKKPSRYDVLTEVRKSVAEREAASQAAAKAEKDAQLKAIADKLAASGDDK